MHHAGRRTVAWRAVTLHDLQLRQRQKDHVQSRQRRRRRRVRCARGSCRTDAVNRIHSRQWGPDVGRHEAAQHGVAIRNARPVHAALLAQHVDNPQRRHGIVLHQALVLPLPLLRPLRRQRQMRQLTQEAAKQRIAVAASQQRHELRTSALHRSAELGIVGMVQPHCEAGPAASTVSPATLPQVGRGCGVPARQPCSNEPCCRQKTSWSRFTRFSSCTSGSSRAPKRTSR